MCVMCGVHILGSASISVQMGYIAAGKMCIQPCPTSKKCEHKQENIFFNVNSCIICNLFYGYNIAP